MRFILWLQYFDKVTVQTTPILIGECDIGFHKVLALYDFPAQHWQSIRTTNPIESTFATIRHRTKRSKECLSRDGIPASVSFRNPMICASENRFFMSTFSSESGLYQDHGGSQNGVQVNLASQ